MRRGGYTNLQTEWQTCTFTTLLKKAIGHLLLNYWTRRIASGTGKKLAVAPLPQGWKRLSQEAVLYAFS
jgi:hypothetical protein